MASTLITDTARGQNNGSIWSCPITDATTHVASVTNTGATDYVDLQNLRAYSLTVLNGAANVCTFTIEGSLMGVSWIAVGYGQGGSQLRTQAKIDAAAATPYHLFLPPADFIRYLRVNVSVANANGCTFTLVGKV